MLGIAGDRRLCEALARALLVQAAVLHAPDDLAVTVLTGPHQHEAWAWARWLPHARDRERRCVARIGSTDAAVARLAGELAALVDERLAGPARRGPRPGLRAPRPLIWSCSTGAYRLGAMPGGDQGPAPRPRGGYLLHLPRRRRAAAAGGVPGRGGLPRRAAVAWVGLRTGRAACHDRAGGPGRVAAAEEIARAWPRCDSTAEAGGRRHHPDLGAAPRPARPRAARRAASVAAGWAASDRSTRAVIGRARPGPAGRRPGPRRAARFGRRDDRVRQERAAPDASSPAWRSANRPDLMNFVLIDYKGGSAFKDCARAAAHGRHGHRPRRPPD